MSNRFLSLIVILLTFAGTISAQRISSDKARQNALKFMQGRQTSKAKGSNTPVGINDMHLVSTAALHIDDEMYIFNVDADGGFVIVSGDERTPAILGYADNGSIDLTDMPENMLSWLMGYAADIDALRNANTIAAAAAPVHPAISAMVPTMWGQRSPYNLKCPKRDGNLCLTGCVSTAMSQVLYYIQPAGCSAIAGYNSNTSLTMPALPATTFNWSIMRPQYGSGDTDAGAQEVAKLNLYCGQSVSMNYGTGSSSAVTAEIISAYKKYFGFSNSCRRIYRSKYSVADWDEILYGELRNHRPVIFSGRNPNGGHAFVCDGYDGNGMYHINWGWNGTSNGFFLLNSLNPNEQGDGGTTGGYNCEVYALIGLKLRGADEPVPGNALTVRSISYQEYATRSGVDKDFSFQLSYTLANHNEGTSNYELTYALYDKSWNMVQRSSSVYSFSLQSGYRSTYDKVCKIGAGLADGTYYLVPLTRETGKDGWNICKDAEDLAITAEVTANRIIFSLQSGTVASYSASNVKVTGNMLMNNAQIISADITNTGTAFSNNIQVYVDGESVSYFSADIDPGETATLTTDYTFTTGGQHTIYLAVDDKPISETISCDIKAEDICNLTFSIDILSPTVERGGNTYVGSGNCEVEVKYTNNTSSVYNSSVAYYLGNVNNGSIHYSIIPSAMKSLYLAPGESKKVTFTFTGLVDGGRYYLLPTFKTAPDAWYRTWNDAFEVYCDIATDIAAPVAPATAEDGKAFTIDGKLLDASSPLHHGIIIRNGRKTASH